MKCGSLFAGDNFMTLLIQPARPLLILFSFFFYTYAASANKATQINQFLSYFGANCSVYGQWSQEAAKTVNSLMGALQAINDDPNCRGMAGAVNDLKMIAGNLDYLESPNNSSDRQLMTLENRKRELFFMLSQPLSASEKTAIQADIRTTQLSIAEYRGYQQGDFENERFRTRVRATQSIIAATNAVFNRLIANESCWVNRPGILQDIAGLGMAVGQVAAIGARNVETSLFIGAGMNLVANIIDFFQRKKLEYPINQHATAIESTAMTCAMETMANQYCGAKDTEIAITLVAEALTSKNITDDTWSSIRLIEREIPNITMWLETVMAGSTPANSANAQQRQDIYDKEQKLKSAKDFVIGLIAEKRSLIDNISIPAKRWIELKTIAIEIGNKIYGNTGGFTFGSGSSGGPNPLTKRFDKNSALYFLVGIVDPPKVNGMIYTFDSFDPYSPSPVAIVDPNLNTDKIYLSFKSWYDDSYEAFLAEKSRVLIDDPLMVFAQAYPRTLSGAQKGLSPRHSLMEIINFLKNKKLVKFGSSSLQIVYLDTIKKLENVLAQIDNVMIRGQDPETALNIISKEAKLDKGVSFLKSRMEFFVKMMLEELILESPNDDPKKIQLLAAYDVIAYLQQFLGSPSLQKMQADAKNAQSVVSSAMLNFMESFAEPINSSLYRYDNLISRLNESVDGPNSYAKTIMCLNLISLPEITDKVSSSKCMGLRLKSVFSSGPGSISIQKTTMSLPFEDRVCNYRNFQRRNNVYQSLLRDGRSLVVNEGISDVISVKSKPKTEELKSNENPVIAKDCQTAEAWKTEANSYCETDWWDGCDRAYAKTCQPRAKAKGLGRIFGF